MELLAGDGPFDATRAAAMQSDITSTAARRWIGLLDLHGSLHGLAERGRRLLIGWDGQVSADSPPALLYACFRRAVARLLFEPVVGQGVWEWLVTSTSPAHQAITERWLGNVISGLEHGAQPLDGSAWKAVLQRALDLAWSAATSIGGPDPLGWRWDLAHSPAARHSLAEVLPGLGDRFDPPKVGLAGDGDTIRCAAYALGGGLSFDVTFLSVYRQVVDLGDTDAASYVVPGGASGVPGAAHYQDQFAVWDRANRIPMRPAEAVTTAMSEGVVTVVPADP